jgi:hypothetical protein
MVVGPRLRRLREGHNARTGECGAVVGVPRRWPGLLILTGDDVFHVQASRLVAGAIVPARAKALGALRPSGAQPCPQRRMGYAYSPSEPLIRPALSTAEPYATAPRSTILASRRVFGRSSAKRESPLSTDFHAPDAPLPGRAPRSRSTHQDHPRRPHPNASRSCPCTRADDSARGGALGGALA